MTNDVETAKRFYADAIGWTFESMAMGFGTYWVAKQADKPVAGVMNLTDVVPASVPPHWFSYLEVDNLDARPQRLEAGGGKLLRPLFEVDGVGRIAIVADPTGAAMGWITPAPR
jgi:predicted enzyme related to lactoylglutathione lyase